MDWKPELRPKLEQLEARDTPAFTPLPPFNAGISSPAVIASADFNGDGFADVAVGNEFGPLEQAKIGIALGNGDGSFTDFQTLADPSLITQPQSIEIADLNGDGHLDLVVSSFSPTTLAGSLLVFSGQSDGSFTGPNVLKAAPTIAAGIRDFTGDGVLDIVALVPDTVNTIGGFEIYAGQGNGVFAFFDGQPGYPFDVNRVITGDFDGDTFNDFIAVGNVDRNLYAFYGDGTGNFTIPSPGFQSLSFSPADIVAGDFQGDGLLDFAISSTAGVTVHRNQGARQFDFNGVNLFTISGTTPARLASADIDPNSVSDIVSVDQTRARVFYGSFGKGFTEDPTSPLAITGATTAADVAIRDANGDGKTDLIVVRRDGSSLTGSDGRVFLNLAPVQTFTTLTGAPNPGVEGTPTTLTSDVLFLGNPFPFGVKPSGVVAFEVNNAFFGNGTIVNGTATLPAHLPAGTHTILARFPGDSRFEASVSDPFIITIAPAAGGGTTYSYEVTGLPTLPGLGADRVASGNFTDDGVSDIALASGPGRPAELSLIDGKSRTEIASVQPFGDNFTGGLMVAAGDIDGDGIADVAVAADIGGGPRVTLYLNRNGRLEITNNFFALDENFRGGLRIALGDIDGDDHADLVVTGGPGAGPRVATYDSDSLTDFQTPERLFADFFAMDPDSRLGMFVAVGDLDGDGLGEIAVSSDEGGGPRVLIFDGESLLDDQPEATADFFVGDPNSRGGLRIAIRDVSPAIEGVDLELIAGDGPGAGSSVRVFSGYQAITDPAPTPVLTSELMPGYLGGVFVA